MKTFVVIHLTSLDSPKPLSSIPFSKKGKCWVSVCVPRWALCLLLACSLTRLASLHPLSFVPPFSHALSWSTTNHSSTTSFFTTPTGLTEFSLSGGNHSKSCYLKMGNSICSAFKWIGEHLGCADVKPSSVETQNLIIIRGNSYNLNTTIKEENVHKHLHFNNNPQPSAKVNSIVPLDGVDTVTASSPLDQFAIHPWIPMNIGDLYFSFTNPSLFMLLTLSLVLLLVHFVTKKGGGNSVPNAWQSLVELIYDFVPNLVNEQIGGLSGNVKQKFFPCISVTFTFSLFCNLQGMIPYSFTVTSHFLITLGLSFSIFIGITIVGFQRNGLHFLSFSLPAGVPLPLAPFLVLLELIPHCFRALSSGIRLFANMMAGHSSVKILSGSAWTMLCMNDLFYFIGDLGPLFIVLALTGPELGVAISQAHVSTISMCIYLNDATNLHQTSYIFIIEQKRRAKFQDEFTR